jgi:hypothetical protein
MFFSRVYYMPSISLKKKRPLGTNPSGLSIKYV